MSGKNIQKSEEFNQNTEEEKGLAIKSVDEITTQKASKVIKPQLSREAQNVLDKKDNETNTTGWQKLVFFSVNKDEIGFFEFVRRQNLSPKITDELLNIYRHTSEKLRKVYEIYKLASNAGIAINNKEKTQAEQYFDGSLKLLKELGENWKISEKEVLEYASEMGADNAGISKKEWRKRYGREFLDSALKAGFDAALIYNLSIQWSIVPPLGTITPMNNLDNLQYQINRMMIDLNALNEEIEGGKKQKEKEIKEARKALEDSELAEEIKNKVKKEILKEKDDIDERIIKEIRNEQERAIENGARIIATLCDQIVNNGKELTPTATINAITTSPKLTNDFINLCTTPILKTKVA